MTHPHRRHAACAPLPRIAATCALLLAASAASAAGPLWSPVAPAASPATAAPDRVLSSLAQDRSVAAVQQVSVDAALLARDTATLELAFDDGDALVAHRTHAYDNPDGTRVWTGTLGPRGAMLARTVSKSAAQVAEDPLNTVVLVRNGDRLTGTIHRDGALYRLMPLARGGHVLVAVDMARLPADHPPGALPVAPPEPPSPRAAAMPGGAGAGTGAIGGLARPGPLPPAPPGTRAPRFPLPPSPPPLTTVRAMVVLTASAAAAVADPQGFVNLAMAETNQGYRNSGVRIRLELAGWYTTDYVTANFNIDLERFTGTSDGYMDAFHATRNAIAADVNVLLINDPAYQYCGLGWLNATAAYAFSVTDYRCATGNYTFAHEIGHNQGAHHDIANATNTSFPYGHGYQNVPRRWRTVMAYACSGVSCPKVNYWSNPKRILDGVVMGQPGSSDNVRVLNETRARVAGFR